MANKKRKNEIQQANQRKAKAQRYEAATKNLFIFPCIALSLCVIALLTFFANFTEIYNVGYDSVGNLIGVEVGVSGWSFVAACLSNGYSSPRIGDGSLANVFYDHAKAWCEPLGILSLFSAVSIVIAVAVLVIAIIKKMHALNLVTTLLCLTSAILLIVCYAKGIDVKNSGILTTYCNDNPLCSVRGFSIIPAVLCVIAMGVSAFAAVKNLRATGVIK